MWAWSLIVQTNSAKFFGGGGGGGGREGVFHHPFFTGSCLTIIICVCSAYPVDKNVFVLLVLLKEMRTLDESEILSFFV